MKFIRRISVTLPLFIICMWLIIHIYSEGRNLYFLVSLVIGILSIILSWFLAGQFQKSRFYYNELKASKKELEVQKENLQEIFDSVDATIWSNDIVNQRIFVSKGIEKLIGYTTVEFYENYSFWISIIHPDDRQKSLEFYEDALSGKPYNTEIRFVSKYGKIVWVYFSGTPVSNAKNEVVKINGVVVDITERKKAESMLEESENRYRNVVELSPNLILIHQHEKIVYANPATIKALGLVNPDELVGQSIYNFVHPSSKEKVVVRSNEIYKNKTVDNYTEYKIVRTDGKIIHLEIAGNEIMYNGEPAIMVVANDISAKKEYEKSIKFMAYHDALTSLPNRHMFNEYLEKAIARSSRDKQELAIMYIDLDRFKFINDSMGHEAGDQLLKQVSGRLSGSVRKGDLVSRQGGDEFAILLENVDETIIREISERILESFSHPFSIQNQQQYTTPSIGISIFPMDGNDKETLLSKADTAMYLAKKRGKNNYQFFLHEQGDILNRKIKLEQDLRNALDNREFYLEYQPKVILETSVIYEVEALVRWKHPELGMVSPAEFIPIVEECGLIITLGEWILNEACIQNRIWLEAGIQIKVAVNVSPIQFEDRHFVDLVEHTLNKHCLPAEYLGLEITESVMQNRIKSAMTIKQLKDLGVTISIDDFGTGYSSLSLLSNLPIDFVKIDRYFISDLFINANTTSLVKSMIEIGENLNVELVAEGIENKHQIEFLADNGCKFGQGFYYSPPLSAVEIEKLLTGRIS
ncbi:EAL domain-containing protein [Fredinandcohnia sp. 179-A 10B2 NHS]|uniref:sensor domain-containing protein n=1 Tax=Fredinandcohnia sp. 179-A 10B2 NHS TaxID=3235176 RepID=UPI0039A2E1E8